MSLRRNVIANYLGQGGAAVIAFVPQYLHTRRCPPHAQAAAARNQAIVVGGSSRSAAPLGCDGSRALADDVACRSRPHERGAGGTGVLDSPFQTDRGRLSDIPTWCLRTTPAPARRRRFTAHDKTETAVHDRWNTHSFKQLSIICTKAKQYAVIHGN